MEFLTWLSDFTQPIVLAVLGIIGVWIRNTHSQVVKAKNAAEDAKEQVTNNHSTNLRDDLDEKFSGIHDTLSVHRAMIQTNTGQIQNVSNRIKIIERSIADE